MDALLPLSVFLMLIAGVIKAIAPIVTTTIAEKHRTERARLSSGTKANKNPREIRENSDISSSALTAKGRRSDAAFGLFGIFVSSAQLGWLQFGPLSSASLTVGVVASVAQCVLLCGIGWFLLVRR